MYMILLLVSCLIGPTVYACRDACGKAGMARVTKDECTCAMPRIDQPWPEQESE